MGTILNWGNPLHRSCPLFLLGFIIITAYIPAISGAAISTGWLLLLIITPILILYCNLHFGFGFLFILYAFISLFWTNVLTFAIFNFFQLIIAGLLFLIGKEIKDLKPIFKGLALGLGVSGIVATFQYFGYHKVFSLMNDPAGLFVNKNIYSEISAVLLISLIALKLWVWIPVTIPGLIFVQSRAAFLSLSIGLFFWAWSKNKILACTLVGLVGLLTFIFYGDNFSLASVFERFSIWKDTINGFTIFGHGVGSYEIMFPFYATYIDTELARPRYAHNDLLNIIFEFGVGSIFAIIFLFKIFLIKNEKVVILYAIFTISLFTYPLHIPVMVFIAFLVAGYISSNNDPVRNFRINWGLHLFKRNKATKFITA